MGAVLTTGLILAIVVAGLEIATFHALVPGRWSGWKPDVSGIVFVVRPLAKLFICIINAISRQVYNLGPWVEAKPIHSLMFSFGLSVMLGSFFPAGGVASVIGAAGSTCFTTAIYYPMVRLSRKARIKYEERKA